MRSFIKNLFKKEKVNYTELVQRGAIIIDVRTSKEFAQGHADSAINIPLSDIANKIEAIKNQNKPVITCCRSGARSGNAATIFKHAGIEVYNGGSWNQVQTALAL